MRSGLSTPSALVLAAALAVGASGFARPAITERPQPPDAVGPTSHRASLPDAAWTISSSDVARDDGPPSARAVLDAVGDLRAPHAKAQVLRTHIEALTGAVPFSTPPPADPETETEEAAPDPPPVWTYADAVPDLDGDGLEDVLEIAFGGNPSGFALAARTGIDGTELWTLADADSSDLWAQPVPDVTGDGGHDLLVWTLEYDDYGCVEESEDGWWCYEWFEEFTWTVRVRDGRTGSTAWTRTFPGSYHDVWSEQEGSSTWGSNYQLTYEVEAENYWIVPLVSDDHDGDGAGDIVLNELGFVGLDHREYSTYDETLPIREDGIERDLEIRSTVSLLEGDTGAAFWQRTEEGADGDAAVLPMGDATGSATGELLWLQFGYPAGSRSCRYVDVLGVDQELECSGDLALAWTTTVELLDGDTRDAAWSRTATDGPDQLTWFQRAHADLDGDGRHDVFEIVDGYDPMTRDESTVATARSGVDGALLWSRSIPWGFPVTVASMDGGEGSDVVLVGIEWNSTPMGSSIRIVLERVDGATGSELLTTSHEFAEGADEWTFVDLYLDEDVDGDAVADVGLWRYTIDLETEEESSSDWLESSATGQELFRIDSDGKRWIYDVADLHVDAGAEVVVIDVQAETITEEFDGEQWTFELPVALDFEAQQHDTGQVLWALPTLDPWGDWLDIGGDLDGTRGADLVESRNLTDPRAISVRNGATAATVWTR